MRKPRFNRRQKYVFVKPYKLGKDENGEEIYVYPGEAVPDYIRLYRLRSLHERNRIGPVDHPWTEAMVAGSSTRTNIHRITPVERAEEGLIIANAALVRAQERLTVAEASLALEGDDEERLEAAELELTLSNEGVETAEQDVVTATTAVEDAVAQAEQVALEAAQEAERVAQEALEAEQAEAAAALAAEQAAAASEPTEPAGDGEGTGEGEEDEPEAVVTELEDGSFQVIVDGEPIEVDTREEAEALL